MKATLLKMSVITTSAIFLFAGASWADGEKNRLHKTVDKKHVRPGPDRSDRHQGRSYNGRGWNESPQHHYKQPYVRHWAAHSAKRHVFKHHHYRPMVIGKHYHRYKPSHNVFSYWATIHDPGWSVTIKTRSRR